MSQVSLMGGGDLPVLPRSYKAELPNILIEYMYRDASNYKSYEIVSFKNPHGISAVEIWRQVNDVLKGVMLFSGQPIFRPERIGLPTVYLFERSGYERNDDDHDWHEIIAVEETDSPSTFGENSDIHSFINALRRTHPESIWGNKST